jgi:predicted GH43/DUF377 family glycosyl hydrolase
MARRIEIDVASAALREVVTDSAGRIRLAGGASGYVRDGELISGPVDVGSGKTVLLDWVEQWTAPQRWTKYAGNPVYGPQRSGNWDTWTNGVSVVPDPDGETYKMFYAGRDGEGIGVAEAKVSQPTEWHELPTSPVLKPRNDNWEGNRINQPRVVVVSDDHWRMYYTGWGFEGPGTSWAMGIAESFDGGLTWSRFGEEPILERGALDSPDGGGACVPMVLFVEGRWMMWYTAGVVNHSSHTQIHLCLAYSKDGLHWEKADENPVLGDDFADDPERSVTSRCYVRHDAGVFRVWYSYACPNYEIRYAESLDGLRWERSPISPVLGPSVDPSWDDQTVEYPEVQIVDGTFRLWFCGNGFGSVGYAEGKAETAIKLAVRSGVSGYPDETWTEWKEVERMQRFDTSRFLQIRARLRSDNPRLSPALARVVLEDQL